MNLLKEYTKSEIELIKKAGVTIEDRDYTREDLMKCEREIISYIMNHSSKNGDINKFMNQYNAILNTFINIE